MFLFTMPPSFRRSAEVEPNTESGTLTGILLFNSFVKNEVHQS